MKSFVKLYLFSFILLSNFTTFAQTGPGDTGDGNLEGTDPAPAPIDGKLILLIIVALLFALYKLKNSTKKA